MLYLKVEDWRCISVGLERGWTRGFDDVVRGARGRISSSVAEFRRMLVGYSDVGLGWRWWCRCSLVSPERAVGDKGGSSTARLEQATVVQKQCINVVRIYVEVVQNNRRRRRIG